MGVNRTLQHPLIAAMYLVMLMLMAKLLFPLDEQIGMVMFFAMLIPFFFFLLRWPNTPGALYGGIFAMLAGKLIYAVTTNPVTGPDEIHYFEQVSTFQKLSDFMPYALDHVVTQWANMSAYPIFGMLYMPLFKWLELEDPLAIIMLNSLLLILVVNQTYRLNALHFKYALPDVRDEQSPRFHGVVIFGLLVSPSFMLLSSVFAKDVACALLGLYGAGLLIRRKYVLFLLVLAYSTGLRDYSIIYTFGIYFLYTQKMRTSITVMIAAMGLLVMQIGPLGLMNASLLTVFLFISPNPVNLNNWNSEIAMRTLEALWMSFILGVSVLNFLRFKASRRFYILAFTVLFTYACTLVLVGYVTVTGREMEYGLGTVGDNMVRKKLPVLPILYVLSAYTLVWGRKWFQTGGAGNAGS
ncbi:hypothetical protein [Paenibacillus spongiae]|uniref:DUF2029 domain-containing protein n=1 Tax=Paenibacillus spongiae TaxID=2909671 RepID=A0ABY5S2W4_9BACL|nr:hypothetical protein [Paenibacillus spongiae]UVI27905.1 hypothetical protein L1F29_20905 [Paenibacillus spongiae]